jgi:hypothetical protein
MAQTYIRCEDEGLLTQILHDKKLESLRFRKLAPQVLVCDFEAAEVIATLREAGYLPAAENASGILISLSTILVYFTPQNVCRPGTSTGMLKINLNFLLRKR